jgi:hypothetical protein
VLLPLARAGADIDGIDASATMIEQLQKKAAAEGRRVDARVADMRAFTTTRRYARVICAFNSFAHAEDTEQQLAALRCMRGARAGRRWCAYTHPARRAEPDAPVMETKCRSPAPTIACSWDAQKHVTEQPAFDQRVPRGRCEWVVLRRHVGSVQRWVYRFSAGAAVAHGGLRALSFSAASAQLARAADQQMVAWGWNA